VQKSLLDQLWELDKEESYARVTITPIKPIKPGEKVKYHWDEAIQIRPYPNPFSYGGQWGSGVASTREEVERHIISFKEYIMDWQKHGLEKVEIRWQPEMTEAERRNLWMAEWRKEHPDLLKCRSEQLSLI